ncbi:MAG: DegQ family serine endoprotease [Proteobacteria bacterium]|nr:DegQ family serine endoprotease [Pseudomonadota bacterium]
MKNNKYLKRSITVIIAALLFGAGILVSSMWDVPGEVSAISSPVEARGAAMARSGLPYFVDMVKSKKPAVVNISTTKVVKHGDFGGAPMSPSDPFRDFFGDDFFDKFFGQIPKREFKSQSLGSGFVIDKAGYILTNNHVVENADEIVVKFSDGREFKAEMIGRDSRTDVALIKIEDHNELPIVELGDSDSLDVGEWVIAIGNPFGVGQTVTAGIVSAKGRDIGAGPYDDFIQTDASINPGNSGGPLFNVSGEVVGINTAIFSPSGGNVGIGFATPINMVKRLLPQLKKEGTVTRGWLGVMIQTITKDLAKTLKLPSEEGALVADVVENSPAEKAGLKRGDVVILFDGEKIGKMKELSSVVASTPVGKTVEVEVLREGKKKTLKAEIEKLVEEELIQSEGKTENLGMTVQEITPEIAKHLHQDLMGGVFISRIERGSAADNGGLKRGDVILEINMKDIRGIGDYKREVKRFKKGDAALFLISRNGNTFYATVKID